MHLCRRRRAPPGAGRRRRRCSSPGGRFIFDVFEPTAADIRATHDRWIARREGISEHPLWDAEARRLALTCACPDRAVAMTLEWRSADEWLTLCAEAGLIVRAVGAGCVGGRTASQQKA